MKSGQKEEERARGRLKIGGMALENGVLFQTARHWAMAVRTADGGIGISSGEKVLPAPLAGMRKIPLLRSLVSMAESVTVLPEAYAHGGQLPALSRSPQILASMMISALGTMIVRNPKKKMPPLVEEIAVTALALVPTLVAMRKTKAIQYHAAEHKSINAYESAGMVDEAGVRTAGAEHPRCGSNLIGPAMVMMTVGNTLARRYSGRRAHLARLGVGILSLSGAMEMVQWAARHPRSLLSKILVGPGEELQHLLTTSEPSNEQIEVGLAALKELLRLEGALEDLPEEPLVT